MENRLQQVIDCIGVIQDVSITTPFIEDKGIITGQVLLTSYGSNLIFRVTINPQYPFQFHGVETIRFVNERLIEFDHVVV